MIGDDIAVGGIADGDLVHAVSLGPDVDLVSIFVIVHVSGIADDLIRVYISLASAAAHRGVDCLLAGRFLAAAWTGGQGVAACGSTLASGPPASSGGDCPGSGQGDLARTPAGRPYSAHYLNETGPGRNIPGSVVDETIENFTEREVLADRTVYYDSKNDVTLVQSDTTGKIMSVRRGAP